MIKEYLLNCRQELLEKKIDITNALQKNELLIKEKKEFKRLIELSEDKSYESFTPHNYRNDKNEEQIKELKKQQKELEDNEEKLKKEIENVNQKIDELEYIIKLLKQLDIETNQMKEELDDNEVFRLKLLETQEYERKRIARELHDSTVQSLTSMIHKIEFCTRLIDMDTNRCKIELQNLSNTVRDTIRNMREVIYNLRPMSLDDIGIDATIERELDRLRKNNDIDISCETTGDSEKILPVIGLTMLRIIQEACNNTIKHANAKKIDIHIDYKDNEIQMKIEDDGCGFDVSKVRNISNQSDSGFGISIMYERVYLLSGTIKIDSEKNKGTRINISIPKKGEL